tara:strand:- start:282 stop:791 length:510 start_codon:yes stop_codon:yes gene_type:complete
MSFLWSVWLLPDEKGKIEYKRSIDLYASLYNTYSFDPHITLFGRLIIDPNLFFSFFDQLTSSYNRQKVETRTIEAGARPWKTIYIDLVCNKSLLEMQKNIDEKFNVYREYKFNPHISLAYGNFIPKGNDLGLISITKTINFSLLALACTPDSVSKWRIIKKYQLKKQII